MTIEKIEEIKNLPLKDRIITNFETKKDWILDCIKKTMNEFDYARYIINKPSKSHFYNGHFILYKDFMEEYSNVKNMLLIDLRGFIIVFPIALLELIKIDELPNIRQAEAIIKFLENKYNITFDDINMYKTKLETKYSYYECANFEYIEDDKFFSDKLDRINVLYENNCKTYEDYNKTYERYQ